MIKKTSDDQYSDEEAERRLVAALRGARITGHKPMSDLPKKRAIKTKPKKKAQPQR
jgi:hypothetical protein